ncbi:MAG: hypothetical protein LLG40_02220 [Deltaproteobacteria bacterium]|nr:hypothetical protein [Deltaproteobacteria bacterium]
MNRNIISMIMIFLLLPGSIWAAQTQESNNPPKPQGRMKPPPEAIAACKGKSEGTAVQFTTPRGDTLKGVCRQFDGVLAAMPERGTSPPTGGNPDENNNVQPEN